ncbi:hypothetical protein [Brevundimonas sp.]|uniref:hypothetical protein n=1 Tax=Brevundimonas sp. TaxID=1871086 RepID=UPI00289B76B8|nr:hypothetical protein [Brevundimonas sp.]
MATWDGETIIEIDAISKAAFHEGHRIIELRSGGDPVRLAFAEEAAINTALQLLQQKSSGPIAEGYGLTPQDVFVHRDAQAGLVITFQIGSQERISLVLGEAVEAALNAKLSAVPTSTLKQPKH